MPIQVLNSSEVNAISGAFMAPIPISQLTNMHFAPTELLPFEITMDLIDFLENGNYEGYDAMVKDMITDNPDLATYNWNHDGIVF